jgi:hypothetical protein
LSEWGSAEPHEAALWVTTWDEKNRVLPAYYRGPLLGAVVPSLARVDAQAAINLARKIEDSYSRDPAFLSIVQEMSLTNPPGAYALTKEITRDFIAQRKQGFSELIWSKWVDSKVPASAAMALVHYWASFGFPPTPNGEADQELARRSIRTFCGRWSMFDLTKAVAWGRAIPSTYSQQCLEEIREASTCAPLSKHHLERAFRSFRKGWGWFRDDDGWFCFKGGFGEYKFGEQNESFCARLDPSDALQEVKISTQQDPNRTLAVLVNYFVPEHRRGTLLTSGDGTNLGKCKIARFERYKCLSIATQEMCHEAAPNSVRINWKR